MTAGLALMSAFALMLRGGARILRRIVGWWRSRGQYPYGKYPNRRGDVFITVVGLILLVDVLAWIIRVAS